MSDALQKAAGERMKKILDFLTKNPIMGALVGALVTAVLQSSSATTVMVIGLAGAIPILLGDNIGTTITALLASIGQSKNAKRTAIAHSIFNISGSIVFIFLIPWFSRFVQFISPAGNEIDVISRQIANAHTTFNVVCTLVWLPLIPLMVKIVTTIISGNDKVRRVSYAPQFAGINANEQQVAEQGTVAVVSFESEKARKAAKGSAAAI